MIREYFRRRQALARVLSTPAGAYLDGLVTDLRHQGFGRWKLRGRIVGAAHFSLWSQKRGVSVDQLHEEGLGRFQKHLGVCRCPRPFQHSRHGDICAVSGARVLVEHLRRKSVVNSPPPSSPIQEQPPFVSAFNEWMRQQRGLAPATLRGYSHVIREAVETLGSDPSRYTAQVLRAFVMKRAMTASRSHGKETVTAMRGFLRYLVAQGLCRTGMDDAIPAIAIWRLAALPRYLAAADVDRIIGTCDEDTAVGLRDRAVLLLLARLGLRAGDIVAMELTDVEWREASIRVSGKGHVQVKLPLTQEVGNAVLRYLQRGRPPAATERLFVRMLAPWTPLGVSSVSALVNRAITRAGVESSHRGAHVLRHSAATEMLRQGATLSQIGVVLRHKHLDTTAHYAKVDVQRLREIAQPWPEVLPC